jgi:hypothetical protein
MLVTLRAATPAVLRILTGWDLGFPPASPSLRDGEV